MQIITSSIEETKQLAYKIAKNIKPKDIIALYGDLGSGKTTFTKYLAEALGFDARVQSPTFVIARKYRKSSAESNGKGNAGITAAAKNGISFINHIDLYRLTEKSELSDLDFDEMLSQEDSVTVIEWPDLFINEFTGSARIIKITIDIAEEDTRRFDVQNLY